MTLTTYPPVTSRDAENLAHYDARITTVTLPELIHHRAAIHFDNTRSPHHCTDTLDDISQHYAVRLTDDTIIAIATLAPDDTTVAGIPCTQRLRWLGTYPDYQHHGLAQVLINIRLHHAHLAGADYAWSDALTTRVPLYISLGAVPDEPTNIYDDDGTGEHLNIRYGPLPMTVPSILSPTR